MKQLSDIGGYDIVLEDDDLGITVKKDGEIVFYLNAIGTTVIKTWLEDFDRDHRFRTHPSVVRLLRSGDCQVHHR